MNFSLIQHKGFEKWIPPSDIDEIDAPPGVLTKALNVNFRNGYFENSEAAIGVSHPTEIQDDIDDGYELLSIKGFSHSEKGNTTIYILYKSDVGGPPTHLLKFWLTGGGETAPKLLNIDEQSSDIAWLGKPHDINYNLVNDQLKINLNCSVKYNDIDSGTDVLANLTLIYLETKSYGNTGLPIVEFVRPAGWYLFPRWLGWNYNNVEVVGGILNGVLSEDFEDINYVDWLSAPSPISWARVNLPNNRPTEEDNGYYIYASNSLDYSQPKMLAFLGIRRLEKLEFDVRWGYSLTPLTISLYIKGELTEPGRLVDRIDDIPSFTHSHREFDLSQVEIKSNESLLLVFQLGATQPAAFSYVSIDNLKLVPIVDRSIVVAKYGDGQRGLIAGNLEFPIFDNIYLQFPLIEIDWRVDVYEIYYKISENLYYLYSEVRLDSIWTLASGVVKGLIGVYNSEENGVATLPFRYGLPADTRVDNQRDILMEVEHKGRIFFINEDYKVYQSHISANLAIQADSFPYDEEVGFGYFITAHNRINKGIAVTPTNYLAIFTDSGFYVYFIQPSSTGSFKSLRLSSGSIGLSSRNTITRALSGDPATDGLFWIDDNGVYYYTGDSQPPKNLILLTHEKYWREEVTAEAKANAVGFYNPLKREYWLKVDGENTIAYELPYDNWKEQAFANLPIDEFYGVFDNVLYYRSGNLFVKFDMNIKSAFNIETAYSTGYITGEQSHQGVMPEIYDKILQEVYMVFADGNDSAQVVMTVFVDKVVVGSFIFNTTDIITKFLTPLGIRFNRVKFRVLNTEDNKIIRVKEFGCSYTPDTKEPLGQQMVDDEPITEQYGYGRSYGRAYGRN